VKSPGFYREATKDEGGNLVETVLGKARAPFLIRVALVFDQIRPPPSTPGRVPERLEDFCGSSSVRPPGEQAQRN
jgi:hypothetical protein